MAFTFLFGLGGRSQYFYAIMLTIMSLNALALCQVTNFHCLYCGEEGSPHYYAARVLSICLGCLAPMLVRTLDSLLPGLLHVAVLLCAFSEHLPVLLSAFTEHLQLCCGRLAPPTVQHMTSLLASYYAICCESHMEPGYATQRLKCSLCLLRLPILCYPGAP